jgi:ABC-type spermidine/putrescine transport system permease subunit I
MKNAKVLGYPYVFWMIVLILFPLVLMLGYALSVQDANGVSFTLENFKNIFTADYLRFFGIPLNWHLSAP